MTDLIAVIHPALTLPGLLGANPPRVYRSVILQTPGPWRRSSGEPMSADRQYALPLWYDGAPCPHGIAWAFVEAYGRVETAGLHNTHDRAFVLSLARLIAKSIGGEVVEVSP